MRLLAFDIPLEHQWEPNTDNELSMISSIDSSLTQQMVLNQYHDVFTGLGRLKVEPVKIHLREDVVPVRRPCRRVPVAIRKQFEDEPASSVKKDVLTKLDKNEVTEWLNSFVNMNKTDGKLRACLDPTGLNPYIIRPVCNSYTLDKISYMLKDAEVFTVVDANKGFFQLPLHEDSKKLTAMLTLCGVYVYNILAMGLSLSSDVFESTIRDIIKDLHGVVNIADDILVFGKDAGEHDRNLLAMLDKCREVNLTLNRKKLKFKCQSVPFFGNIMTNKGIRPDPSKVQAIKDWPVPNCLKDLQSFLGAVNFLSKLIPKLSKLVYLYRVYVRRMLTSCGLKLIGRPSIQSKMLFVRRHYCLIVTKTSPFLLKLMPVGKGLVLFCFKVTYLMLMLVYAIKLMATACCLETV